MFFIHFNLDGTISKATIRNGNGEQPHDLSIMEAWEFYQTLIAQGMSPTVMALPNGSMEIFQF